MYAVWLIFIKYQPLLPLIFLVVVVVVVKCLKLVPKSKMELSEGTKTTNYNVSKKYIQKPNRNN